LTFFLDRAARYFIADCIVVIRWICAPGAETIETTTPEIEIVAQQEARKLLAMEKFQWGSVYD